MIAPVEIHRRALRHYNVWLKSIAAQDPDFKPLVIKRTGDDRSIETDRLGVLQEIVAESKSKIGYGYQIELEPPAPRSKQQQSRIAAIVFDTPEDLLRYIDREAEYERFIRSIALLKEQAPHLMQWSIRHVREVCSYADTWPALLSVMYFFRENPAPNLPLRLLPIEGVDTKFMEEHNSILCKIIDESIDPLYIDDRFNKLSKRYKLPEQEPFVPCYFNDPALIAHYHGFSSMALPVSQLSQISFPVRVVIVVENQSSIHQLLQQPLPQTLLVFGGGYGVALLKHADWLRNVQLYYWGDIDAHGFAILSQVRSYFPHVQSMLMDNATLMAHDKHHTAGKPFKAQTPAFLTDAETELFEHVKDKQLRLEQERLSQRVIAAALR